MDLSPIPKVFWYSIAFSIPFAIGGFLYIACQSSKVTIEVANAKMELCQDLVTTKSMVKDIQNYARALEVEKNKVDGLVEGISGLLVEVKDKEVEAQFQKILRDFDPNRVVHLLPAKNLGELDKEADEVLRRLEKRWHYKSRKESES
jgi:hypothetical protein